MSVKLFSLKILASDRVFYEGKCKMIIVPAMDGQLGIMANHGDLVAALDVGEIRIQKEDDTWERALIGTGIMQDINNRVTILTEFAEHPEEIDVKRASEARERAEEQLRQKQSIQEYHQSKAALARAIARLKESGREHPTGY
ncbi:MAG: ATP synthase F1 subunit epsilon [Eubacteriales bacterium]|nr:ATP synthase F1 subunit epsilon [Eubacteriales bacterium]